ncbi:putative phosphoglycerate mutase pmu1 [Podospora pseudocomata]|uniref:Phosphoglycerate mutase pmu1 n=1 Tax=Podospora pseudocomata TaxID=2093779 RepID=A0ABR0G9C1_9PEZI|nr:putative phosphoglycerate mutase pmu1 [Podospora pseudocomata]
MFTMIGQHATGAGHWSAWSMLKLLLLTSFPTLSLTAPPSVSHPIASSESESMKSLAALKTMAPKYRFTAVPGYFKMEGRGPRNEVPTMPGMGLIDQPYPTDEAFDPQRSKQPWERFVNLLNSWNESEKGKAAYKLIYVTRHGQGYHNAKESDVGSAEWETRWVMLNGDDNSTWFDSHLTLEGIRQAMTMNAFWQDAATKLKLPLPRRYYASPLARCLETCKLSFEGIELPPGQEKPPFKPIIKELLRERLHFHTCDRRRNGTWIRENFPEFEFEEGFVDEDVYWKTEGRETLQEHAARTMALLEDVFEHDDEQIISFSTHSGTIAALIKATGHEDFFVEPGNVVPFLIKGEIIQPN